MPSPTFTALLVRRRLRRFRVNHRGSAAVEFALVAPTFFALLFAILETGILFLAGQLLETITLDAARTVLTGQVQAASYTSAQFTNYVCGKIPALFNCSGISIDVQNYPSFTSINLSSPIDSNRNFVGTNLHFNPGGPGDVVVVRLFYQWPQIVTGLGWNPSNLSGNKRLLVGTAVFKNEPY
ncbi:pilus assembly protein [Bradyrhizobium sp. WYCCWR 13023]|uniref:Pilus assembly protein n=1 Tax=Bradyrhizobium zhengyangense TaxID=2911009 RepID=A0A9X1RKT4_9BRAD|nr:MULTISPECIES: TadE/TadG family type IV pilus assembly protein [Bradyrhizobium]MCG2633207.1 pilus assembly protein [Bradyrhizobium zhengyangense]MCG2672304.1 pilus assembly protein [Bradyrhizobium zhengyangense]MDA9521447.1 pilus assembly protein TadG [Bradyrhizobium sp. CCBAU 11434]